MLQLHESKRLMEKFSSFSKETYYEKNSNNGTNKKFKTFINQDNTLSMQIFDEEASECYDLVIDDRYLKNRQDLSSFFTTPLDMHYTLFQLKDQIIMTEDYKVVLNLNLSASKVNITKQFIFQLKLNLEKTLQQQRQKINMLQIQLKGLHRELDQQRKKNWQKEASLFQEISELKNQKTLVKCKLDQAIEEIEKLNKLMLQKEKENQELKICLQERKEEISSYESSENNNKIRVIELEQTIKLLELSKMKKDLLLNQANPHYFHFHYFHTDVGTIKITKTSQNGWKNFISNALLPQNQSTIFQMKVNATKDGSISMGICNNLIFGSSDMSSPMSITYFIHDGSIFQRGGKRFSGPPILIGQSLKLQINWKNNTLNWFNGQTRIGESLLDSSFKLNNMFLIVRVFWKQDQVELK